MTIFTTTASPGQRWKVFLAVAGFINGDADLSAAAAAALTRRQWSCGGTVPAALAPAAVRGAS